MYENITYITAVVLIPLVPAFVLYRFLPQGRTNVKGPFRGLDIKLSGAFAGYFLVVLIVASFVVFLIRRKPPPPPPAYQYEVYTVTGAIDLQSGEQSAPKLDPNQFTLSLLPPERTVRPDGSFSFEIPVRRGQAGQAEFPDLILSYPSYEQATVHLDVSSPYQQTFNVNYNKDTKRIDITPMIRLTPVPPKPYQANTQPQPAP